MGLLYRRHRTAARFDCVSFSIEPGRDYPSISRGFRRGRRSPAMAAKPDLISAPSPRIRAAGR